MPSYLGCSFAWQPRRNSFGLGVFWAGVRVGTKYQEPVAVHERNVSAGSFRV